MLVNKALSVILRFQIILRLEIGLSLTCGEREAISHLMQAVRANPINTIPLYKSIPFNRHIRLLTLNFNLGKPWFLHAIYPLTVRVPSIFYIGQQSSLSSVVDAVII